MRKFSTAQFAAHTMLSIMGIVVIFHVFVLIGIVPYTIVWGGKLKDTEQMIIFEGVSIILNLLMASVVAIHAGILRARISQRVIRVLLWIMAILFLLNTIGNFFSDNSLERALFTPLTLLLGLFSLRLALEKKPVAVQAD